MKKIAIITYINANNWGAVLQGFSLQNYLLGKGYLCKQIDYGFEQKKVITKVNSFKTLLFAVNDLLFYLPKKQKINKFSEFRRKYIMLTEHFTPQSRENIGSEFDVYITGSDQVWNCGNGVNEAFYLNFVKSGRKVAYAPSFGISEVPSKYKMQIKKLLSDFAAISVRENTGTKIVEDITGNKAEVVCDPVFLTTQEEWSKIISFKIPKKKYIFVYPTQITPVLEDTVRILKEKTGYDVISPHRINGAKVKHNIGPLEFLGYIKNAEFVVASSFHATAFSIIFKKQFYSICHTSTGSRIADMLNNFGLYDRIVTSAEQVKNIKKINYDNIMPSINATIKESKDFLKRAIEGEK